MEVSDHGYMKCIKMIEIEFLKLFNLVKLIKKAVIRLEKYSSKF